MHVDTIAMDGLATLTLSGQIDFSTHKTLQQFIDAGIAHGHCDFVLDLDEVTSMDSSGLGALVACLDTIRKQGGSLSLIQVPAQVQELMAMTNLTNFFNL